MSGTRVARARRLAREIVNQASAECPRARLPEPAWRARDRCAQCNSARGREDHARNDCPMHLPSILRGSACPKHPAPRAGEDPKGLGSRESQEPATKPGKCAIAGRDGS
jgi:hypothetical protein